MVDHPDAPVIVTAALMGARASRLQCPAIPYTPAEIAEEARRAWQAGATVVHVHARGADGAPSDGADAHAAVLAAIRARCPVLVSMPTGGPRCSQADQERRVRAVQPDIATLDLRSLGAGPPAGHPAHGDFDPLVPSPLSRVQRLLIAMNEAGVKPSLGCFDAGHPGALEPLRHLALLRPPLHHDLRLGTPGGIPPTVPALQLLAAQVPPGSLWQVSGVGRVQWRLVAAGVLLDGHVRVGLEDNFFLPDGDMARSNGELVARAVRLTRDIGRRVATLDEARHALGLDP